MTLSEGGLISIPKESLNFSSIILAMSFTSNLPGIAGLLPIKPFVNILLNNTGINHNISLFYEAGIKAGIWNFFEIYLPFPISGNIHSADQSFRDRIRFVFNLESVSKIKLNSKFF